MARPLRPATLQDVQAIDSAVVHLRRARDLLTGAGADKAAARVRLALSSADGALRHVDRRLVRPVADYDANRLETKSRTTRQAGV